MPNRNVALLTDAARLLRPVLSELVFVGGSTTSLLITDKAAAEVRPTYDLDAIAEITSYAAYADFSERLTEARVCGGHKRRSSHLSLAPTEHNTRHHASR